MSRKILYFWLPALILVVCAALVLPGVFENEDASSEKSHSSNESTPDSAKTDLRGWKQFAVDSDAQQQVDFTGEETTQTETVPVQTTESTASSNKFNREEWEASGDTLEERIRARLKNRPLPKMEKPLYVQPMVYSVTLQRKMKQLREEALAAKDSSAWGHLKFTPEMVNEDVIGLRLTDASAADFLAMHDLEDGDIVKRVNGNDINSYQSAFDAINTIGQSQQLQLLVDRSGEMINVDIDKSETEFTSEEFSNE